MDVNKKVDGFTFSYAMCYAVCSAWLYSKALENMENREDWKFVVLKCVMIPLLMAISFKIPFFRSLAVWFCELGAKSPERFKKVVAPLWWIHFLATISFPLLSVLQHKQVIPQHVFPVWVAHNMPFLLTMVLMNFVVLSLELLVFYAIQRAKARNIS